MVCQGRIHRSGSAERMGESCSLGEHLVGYADGQGDPVGQRAGQEHPRVAGTGQPVAEPGGHVGADVLAVPDAVLYERHADVVGQ